MTEVIDATKLVDILENIVKANGYDHTAECQYMDAETNQPICIAGQVVYRLGGRDALEQLIENRAINLTLDYAVFDSVKNDERHNADVARDLGLTEDALELLAQAQIIQDEGEPWGEALGRVKEMV